MSLLEYGLSYIKDVLDTLMTKVKYLEEVSCKDVMTLPNFPRAIQLDDFSCGAQCVYMVLQYYGKNVEYDTVRRVLKTDKDGTYDKEVRGTLKKYGLVPKRLLRPTIADIRKAIDKGAPVIASFDNDKHYAVVFGYYREGILVADPRISISCRYSLSDFKERWDNAGTVVYTK